jgi:hypothetical protein
MTVVWLIFKAETTIKEWLDLENDVVHFLWNMEKVWGMFGW